MWLPDPSGPETPRSSRAQDPRDRLSGVVAPESARGRDVHSQARRARTFPRKRLTDVSDRTAGREQEGQASPNHSERPPPTSEVAVSLKEDECW